MLSGQADEPTYARVPRLCLNLTVSKLEKWIGGKKLTLLMRFDSIDEIIAQINGFLRILKTLFRRGRKIEETLDEVYGTQ